MSEILKSNRGDRWFVVSTNTSDRYGICSLRRSHNDREPMSFEEAVRRYDEQIGNEDLVLVEIHIVAKKRRTGAPLKLEVVK